LYAGLVQCGEEIGTRPDPRGTKIAFKVAVKIAQSLPRGADARRAVSYLIEELRRLGHQVSVLESAAAGEGQRFDAWHVHLDAMPFPPPHDSALVTVHGSLDRAAMAPALAPHSKLVSVSLAQRAALPGARWAGNVYYGLPREVCPLNPVAPRGPARYLAFVGPAAAASGFHRAMEIAMRARVPLKIAGDLDEAAKPGLLGNAAALLFPSDRPEPSGLPAIEAMSCGTPVIAWTSDVAAEIVEPGETGFVAASVEDAARAVDQALRLNRTRVRERFEHRFSAERMARDYLSLYRSLATPYRQTRAPVASLR
jgi:glycosyltransferase involved in cell wall biosynthesis